MPKETKKKNTTNTSTLIDVFPNEILLNILEYLSIKDLFNVFLVNKKFSQFKKDEYLWYYILKFYHLLKQKAKIMSYSFKNVKRFKTWKKQFMFYCLNIPFLQIIIIF